ncbi:3-deoxy-7-phosphoheptulonate synthase class II [Pseudomonas lundensis]|uniref:3-deoxy-7-phosphoheptulonate synthase class II n=1 Tax=Serratia proteamaculans TaxID=28151 RepID=UPI002982A240|nr:3-deoxy-7-phosphoheptulonate synthase class II [Serratia proteamaculans]MDW5498293.1 3-deoxy-7-phosphoheptulonate synthase class II [Serratia proteamaculans]MDW5503351.1 3-deoxy-7-phosphoheptulonate synthase class II [Pseudomonas lundensis]
MIFTHDIDVLTGEFRRERELPGGHLSQAMSDDGWSPSSWRSFPAKQLPVYPDSCALQYYQQVLQQSPPLVLASEIRQCQQQLAQIAEGRAFLLQGGDCAESFADCQTTSVRDHILTMEQMAALINQASGLPVLKIGRIAGQFAKPRSQPEETLDGVTLPSFRGDIINGREFTPHGRTPDPQRMLRAYQHSASTLNLIRALDPSVFTFSPAPQQEHVHPGLTEQYYRSMHRQLQGCYPRINDQQPRQPLFTSHEALLLPYEEALTRRDAAHGRWYNCSAHMLWLGERTGDIDFAHVEYLRGIANPVGIKCGPAMTQARLLALLKLIDPHSTPGKIVLIARMGLAHIEEKLPALIQAVKGSGHPVIWVIDPMHGNTSTVVSGHKTRVFATIVAETQAFTALMHQQGVHPGGLHIEMTGVEVTECTGGLQQISDRDLTHRYYTACDPRLNRTQSLELAFLLGQSWHHRV